jgi:hypothetical protein
MQYSREYVVEPQAWKYRVTVHLNRNPTGQIPTGPTRLRDAMRFEQQLDPALLDALDMHRARIKEDCSCAEYTCPLHNAVVEIVRETACVPDTYIVTFISWHLPGCTIDDPEGLRPPPWFFEKSRPDLSSFFAEFADNAAASQVVPEDPPPPTSTS